MKRTPIFDQAARDHGIERTRTVGTLVPVYTTPAQLALVKAVQR